MNLLLIPVALLYFLISGTLFIFGTNFIYLSLRAMRDGRSSRNPLRCRLAAGYCAVANL